MTVVRLSAIAGLAAALAFTSTGCATKKYLRNTISPLESRIGQLENTSKETEKSVNNLEQNLSRTDERARGAESRASQAAEAAQAADARAMKSGEAAEAANRTAVSASQATEQVGKRASELDNRLRAIDDYAVISEGNVLFPFNKSELDDEAKQSLDAMAAKVQPLKRFVIEIQGFTDQVGAPDYNLSLSQQRASAVQRYLIMQHKVPLHRITILGVGEDAPVADNKTRDGRKQNRRVEVRVYSADEALTGKKVEARLNTQ
jgi:OOP family OmpA-OmpF porin